MRLRYEKATSSFVFKGPTRKIQENYIMVDSNVKKLQNLINAKYEKNKNKFTKLISELDAYSPLKTLSRGYTITQKEGKTIKSQAQLQKGDNIEIRFSDGHKNAVVS